MDQAPKSEVSQTLPTDEVEHRIIESVPAAGVNKVLSSKLVDASRDVDGNSQEEPSSTDSSPAVKLISTHEEHHDNHVNAEPVGEGDQFSEVIT